MTDSVNMDLLLTDKARTKFAAQGLEVKNPPECEAERTVMLKNADGLISWMTKEEIKENIDRTPLIPGIFPEGLNISLSPWESFRKVRSFPGQALNEPGLPGG